MNGELFRVINIKSVNNDRTKLIELLENLNQEGYDLISHAIWRTHWDESGSFIFKKRQTGD